MPADSRIIPPPAPPFLRIVVTVDARGTMNIESQNLQANVAIPLIQAASVLTTASKHVVDLMIQAANKGNGKAVEDGDEKKTTLITGE